MRCPPGPIQGSRQAHSPKALDNAPEAYGREPEEAETEPESEDRAIEDAQPARNTLPDGRMECEFCGRKFNPASYERHQPICQKVFGGSRPQFLASYGASKGANDRARGTNRGGASMGQSSQNGHSPRSLGKAQRSQPGPGSPRGEHSSKTATASQRTSDGPAAGQSPAHEPRVTGQDSKELEQRVMRVMSDQMEELRNLRQQVREEPESSVPAKTGSPRLEHGTKVEPDSAVVRAVDSAGTCAPRPQERARRAPKSPTNPEERLLPQPKKVAGEDRSLAKGSLVSAAEMQLIPCEDCGRRFNPASLEKHRAVCRNVFGKTRTAFESQNQRLRGVKAQEPVKESASDSKEDASMAAPRRRHRAVLEAKVEVHPPATAMALGPTPSSSSCRAEAPAHERGSRGDRGGTSPRRPARESDLQPCPHCQRSFRPAVVDKHVKVCQSVFPSHDVKRIQNSREHRNGKGNAPEVEKAPSESRGSKAAGTTPARGRPKAADQVKPKEVEAEVQEPTPVVFGGEQGGDPGSPIWSLAFEAPQAQGTEKTAPDGLDVWEQEVEEAIQAMSEPMQEVSPLTMETPASASCGALQERATLLERARLGMKMGQSPQQALFGSTSEVALTAERYRAFLPASADATTPADRVAQQSAAPRFFQAHGNSNMEASQRRGGSDFLSRSQPVVPTLTEAPLSSRSNNRPRTMEGSPMRRCSFQSLGQTESVGPSRASGLRLPVERREPQPGPQVEIRTAPRSQVAAKVKPGVGREDPAPAKISLSQSFTLSASGTSSPLQSRSGSMQLPVRSQRTPREQPQAFAVPAAPPPSPSVPARQRAPITFETVSAPQVVSPAAGGVSPWEVSSMPLQRGYVSNLGCTTSSPLLRVRSVEPPRTAFMMHAQRTVPRLDLGKLRRP